MSTINFCNTKEQLNHLGEVVTGKTNGSPSGADIDTSTLPYTGQVRNTLPALEELYLGEINEFIQESDQVISDKTAELNDAVNDFIQESDQVISDKTAEFDTSIANKEVEADAAIDTYRLLSKGPYAAGILLEDKFQYITYNGESYFATNPPYTTTTTTPDADGNLFVGGYTTLETVANKIGNPNLLSNHNFLIQTPDDSQPLPSATPTSYPPGHQIFSGVFANETTGITNLTYIDGRVSFSGGDLYFAVSNTGAIARLTAAQLTASVADFDGKPRTRGVSFALVGGEYRVTVGVDALEDESANETLLGSVKLEQGSVATRHDVQSAKGQTYTYPTVLSAILANPPVGSKVVWEGYYSRSDGGSNWGVVKSGTHTEDGGSIFSIDASTYIEANLCGKFSIKKFGAVADAKPDNTGTDNQPFIQAAVHYAESRVSAYGSVDQRGGAGITLPNGSYITRSPIRIAKSNISVTSKAYATIQPDFPLSQVPSPDYAAVFIIGSAEDWLSSPTISDTTKYNALKGFRISRTGGNGSPIGVLLTGARSMVVDHIHVEQLWCGMWLENVSELDCRSFSAIGVAYGIIGDSRKNRSAGLSPLGVANVDNDVSSNTFIKTTCYFAQHTGVLLINTGTCDFIGTTMGKFSESPDSGPSIRYGLTGKAAGFHVWGGNTNYTRGCKLDSTVYEPSQSVGVNCILITSENADNPVLGVTMDNQTVQTYVADHDGGEVTVLLAYEAYNGGDISGCKLSNSGFLPASSGYYVPTLMRQSSDLEVGTSVQDSSIIIDNCYPTVSVSTSNIASSRLRDIEYIEQVDLKDNLSNFVPAGWTRVGTATSSGGVSGVEASIAFSGNAFNPSYMWKKFSYNNYISRLGSPYLSLWYRGDAPPFIDFIVNGISVTARTTKSGDNIARYSNAIQDFPASSKWRRAVYLFRPFSANYPFDELEIQLGRVSADAAQSVEIKNVEIGFYKVWEMPYNPF